MNPDVESLFRENMNRMSYDEFTEWKTTVFDTLR